MRRQIRQILCFLCFAFIVLGMTSVSTDVLAKGTISRSQLTLSVGEKKTVKLKGTSGKVKWSSNKKSVATVDSKGKITAKGRGSAVITAKNKGVKYTCKVCVYKVSYSNKKVADKAKKIIKKEIKGKMSDAEKIKAIHDYMVLNCEYDYRNYLNGTIPRTSYEPAGVLLKKKSVCQGYAETFELFMDALGIECKIVTGTGNGGGHAWNIVKVNKKWYHVDVTWDDPVPDEKGRLRHEYFLIPDKVMDDDHWWNKSNYPKCTASSDKFITLFGKVSNNRTEVANALYEQYKAGNKKLTLIIPKKLYQKNPSIMSDALDDVAVLAGMNECYGYSYSHYEYGKYNVYSIEPWFQ